MATGGVSKALPGRKKQPPALPTSATNPVQPAAAVQPATAATRAEHDPEREHQPANHLPKKRPPPLPASTPVELRSDSTQGGSALTPSPPLPPPRRPPPPALPTAKELEQFRATRTIEPQSELQLLAWEAVRLADRIAAKEVLEDDDGDENGCMDLSEVRATIERRCPGADAEYVDELIERFDRDSNGTLDLEEFEELYTLVLKYAMPAQVCSPPWLGGPWFEGNGIAGCCDWVQAVGRSINSAGKAVLTAMTVSVVLLVGLAGHCCPAVG
eukprot:COSAG03_NODE_6772_length_1008_cov_0.688669_1_plen_270_part_10